jgi:hypothetical protein
MNLRSFSDGRKVDQRGHPLQRRRARDADAVSARASPTENRSTRAQLPTVRTGHLQVNLAFHRPTRTTGGGVMER